LSKNPLLFFTSKGINSSVEESKPPLRCIYIINNFAGFVENSSHYSFETISNKKNIHEECMLNYSDNGANSWK
jgi:hypothetical protein